jgi:GT2 family glycosyltransferase
VDCLRRTIAAAEGAGLAGRFQVVVVDNGSTDGTAERIELLAGERREVKLIRLEKNCGPVAKNAGIAGNKADIIVLLDDDAYPMPGALPQMLHHFREDPRLAAAVFDVTLPDGTKEASAYPDVFIGAGTALRNEALQSVPKETGGGLLPRDFFMQAEEYDLSFRLLAAGWTVQRFWDMPLVHLKSPGARIGQRTTRLDVRNNLYLLARYLPEPLCHQFAADWLARYFWMALGRDEQQVPHPEFGTHKEAFLRGAAQGLRQWTAQREGGNRVLPAEAVERIFKFDAIRQRMARARDTLGWHRIAFADFGKNMLAFYHAAQSLGLPVIAVVDENLSGGAGAAREYRGIPLVRESELAGDVDALVLTTISPVHAQRRLAALQRTMRVPVVDLFSKRAGATCQGALIGAGA